MRARIFFGTLGVKKLTLAFCLALLSLPASAQDKTEVRVGIIDSFNPEFSAETLTPTIAYLNLKLPAYHFIAVPLNSVDPKKDLERNPPEFFISSAGTFYELSLSSQAVHIATRKSMYADDPSQAEGAAFVALANREDLTDLASLKNKVVAASQPNSFEGWLVPQRELHRQGYDPEKFFRKAIFSHFQFPDALMMLLQGEADVAIVSSCLLESLAQEGLLDKEDFKIIEEKNSGSLRCAHSTDLYPGIVFASREETPPKLAWEVTSALISMPPTHNYEWTIARRFSKVDELYKDLQLGPYSYLRDWSAAGIFKRYKIEILLTGGILMLLLLNSLYLRKEVNRRTLQVKRSLERQIKLEKDYRDSRRRLSQMERFGVISQMSGMLAHEVQQPLLAINNYLAGLSVYLDKKGLNDAITGRAISSLQHNSDRIKEIVMRVRGYAKQKKGESKPCDLAEIARSALESLKALKYDNVKLSSNLPQKAPVVGDPLELELLIINLLKNACSAVEKERHPLVALEILSENSHWLLTVSDNGPGLNDISFARLKTLGDSVKPDGLGIGLSLVRGIVDNHGGTLDFKRLKPHGICASFRIEKRREN